MSTKNLGSVKAYIRSATAPTNIDILWRDISVSPNDWKAYDTVKLKWESILGSTEVITVESATVYDPNRAVGYEAGNTFVSFVNENSANPIFQTAALYRCRVDAVMGVSPEDSLYIVDTNPTGAWEYQGDQVAITEGSTAQTHVLSASKLKEITGYKDLHTVVVIDESIVYQYQTGATTGVQPNDNQTPSGRWVNIGSSGGGDTIDASGFNGNLTPSDDTLQNVAQKFDDYESASDVEELGVTTSSTAKKVLKVNATGDGVDYTAYDFDQVLNIDSIDVSDPTWAEQAERLLLVKKVSGEPVFEGAAELIDLILPPATITSLMNDVGWVGEARTLTGENYLGEIAKLSQIGMGADGTLFLCTSSSKGTQGGANGSASFRRNRSVDALDMGVTNDVNIANLLDPTRVGDNADTNWDTVNNVLIITTLTCKVGSWFTQGTGYHFHCYARSGTSYYWRRIGQPQSIQLPINSTTHPNICTALTAHDWGTGWYTQTGLETVYQDQYWADAVNEQFYKKVTTTKWKRF